MFNTLCWTAYALLAAFATAERPRGLPYALCWGTSSVTASRFTSASAFQAVTFLTSGEYGNLFNDALVHYDSLEAKDKIDVVHTTAIFREAVQVATKGLTEIDGESPTFSMLVLPSVFERYFTVIAHSTVLPVPEGPDKQDGALTSHPASTAGYAYNLNRCEKAGRTPQECQNLDVLNDKALVIDFEQEYLGLHIIDLAYELGTLPREDTSISSRFGEENANVFRMDQNYDTHAQGLREFVTGFLESGQNSVLVSRSFYMDEIKAIVVAGSASTASFAELVDMAQETIGHQGVQIFDSIDPSTVVAQGAAAWAGWILPELMRGYRKPSHDEL
ncbi:hypothetical protein K491DRAFT_756462 [Lophiostoma macrostomum CBS 122681]|uniref:Periplasmic binding protein-like II n=1 Tax=Lophiostoma macrostomum CBS 122681 TaxID=1314788 RepID=A0A6A6TGJ5_9PLEO|nr:hypothetical protein K491DRAFT_756462 [Lophiostoma macrostomum CBS 122681]